MILHTFSCIWYTWYRMAMFVYLLLQGVCENLLPIILKYLNQVKYLNKCSLYFLYILNITCLLCVYVTYNIFISYIYENHIFDIFSPILWLAFTFYECFFQREKVINFDEVQHRTFSFMIHYCVFYLRAQIFYCFILWYS